MVHEFYGDISVTDTIVGIDFHYDSILVGNYIATGIVYVNGLPTAGMDVYCNIGGSLRPYITDSFGKYTVVVPEKTSFSIHPSYKNGYRVSPPGGYSVVNIMENFTGNDFYYYSLSSSDTVRIMCGVLDGLADNVCKGQTVTAIVQGVVHYTATDYRGGYCFEGVPAHSTVVVLAPDIAGYEHTPAIRTIEMPAFDTVILPFVYTSMSKDSVTLCGIVSGLPDNSDILVTYFVGNNVDTLRTDSVGVYCVKVAQGDYVRIVPSYQDGYRFIPNMYFLRADSSQSIFDIEYIPVGNGSVTVTGTVLKDGIIFTNTFLHYTVISAIDTVEGIAMTDIYGKYYIHGLEKGSNIQITPDYVKRYTVLPLWQSVNDLQADWVLDTFCYTSSGDTVYYSVGGTLYGLSPVEQEGLNIVYYVDGIEGSDLLFTDVDGRYIIDSLPDSTYVSVIAPVVEGYSVYPSSYSNITVRPSYYGANFVYSKIDTVSNRETDTFYCIKGRVYGLPDNTNVTIHYRVTDSTNITSSTVVTVSDSTYSICRLPYGSRVQVSAESKDGFMVHEFYGNIFVTDTVVGIDFHYESIPAGYYTATGIVYVNGSPTPGVEVYSNISNSLRSYTTDIYGKYTIVVPERTTFSIHPSYMSGYKVNPSGGYSIVQILENSGDNNFYYSPLTAFDTVNDLCGSIEGLTDDLLNGQIVTAIVHGVVYYSSTDVQGRYCFRGVPARSTVVVLPPDVASYEHNPAILTVEMPIYDTVVVPFVYTSLLKDTVTLCGTVIGLPDNGNVLVTYFVNNSVDTLYTNAAGEYCIKAVEGDYVRIIPSYQDGYRFVPNMYFFRAYTNENIFDIEYISVDTNVSVNISGVVVKDGELFANAFLHYTITSGNDTIDEVSMTDIYGTYHISGVEKGGNVEVVPDYVKYHTVTPLSQFEGNLQNNKVLDTFYYTSSDDTVYYSVRGALFGLSLVEQDGLNIVYSVNDAEGSDLLFTGADGKNILDSLQDGVSVTVTAPVVAGYSVYPLSHTDIRVGPSYNGANFVYKKVNDTVIVPPDADTARLEGVVIGGEIQEITDTIHYILECDDERTSVDVVLAVSEYDTVYFGGSAGTTLTLTGEREYTYTVDMSAKALYRVDTVIVKSTVAGMAGQVMHTYIVIVEKRFKFYDIVNEYIKDRVFMVNNNSNINGGYEFISYRWYIDDVFNGKDTNQTLLSGPGYEYKFSNNRNLRYRVELLTVDGTPLQTCSDVSGVTVYPNAVYPNPAPKMGEMHFVNPQSVEDYHTATLYTVQGHKIWQKQAAEIGKGFTTPNVSGAYILLLQGKNGTVRYKVVVN
jgi:hypothetical protein